jgi:small subunit ribosomal protein S23
MGRLNLTAQRVRATALAKLQTKQIPIAPPWLDIMADIPPAQILIRQQPQSHAVQQIRTKTVTDPKTGKQRVEQVVHTHQTRKASTKKQRSLFKPHQINYEEDRLRRTFYSDHPWELARPRVIRETSGDSHENADWSTGLLQPGIPLSGESVVQRQLYLLATITDITIPQSYDIARKEFYYLRRKEERRDRIAEEEARHNGAVFGPSLNKISLGVENAMYNDWEKYAREQNFEASARISAMEGGVGVRGEEDILRLNYEKGQQGDGGLGGKSAEDEQDPLREVMPQTRARSRNIGAAVFAMEAAREAGGSKTPVL